MVRIVTELIPPGRQISCYRMDLKLWIDANRSPTVSYSDGILCSPEITGDRYYSK